MAETKEPWNLLERDDYAFRWRWCNPEHRGAIEWEVHKIAGKEGPKTIYEDDRQSDNLEAFADPSFAPIEGGHILSGYTKFDGCSNIQQTNTDCMMHFCGTGMLVDIAKDIHSLGLVFAEETGSGWE